MLIRRIVNTAGGYRSPFDEFNRLQQQVDLLSSRLVNRLYERQAGVFPLINLNEDKDHFYVRAELSGLKPEDIDIQATGKTISLKGERKIPFENEGAKYHRRERESGNFSRIINLSKEIDTEKINANLVDGILTVVLPKSEKAKPKQIAVN